jgi:hypothetical protein
MITHPGTPVPGWDVPPNAPQEAVTFEPAKKKEKKKWSFGISAGLKWFKLTFTKKF